MARISTPSDGIAWVTGASSGIGRDVVLGLAKDGWTVAVTARSSEALVDLAKEAQSKRLKGQILPFPGDIGDRTAMDQVVQAIEAQGPVALAVLNAGIYLPVDAARLDLDRFERSVDINLKGTAFCLKPLIEAMVPRGQGQIVLVSSVTGYGGLPTSAAYGATKAALNNLAETLAIELAPKGIHINLVCPGFVDTPAQDDLDFPKPFMVSSKTAAKRIVKGLKKGGFEITFPRRFTFILKVLTNFLPKSTYINLIRKQTGWDKR